MKKHRRHLKSLDIVPTRMEGGYGIYWKGRTYPDVRLSVEERDGVLQLTVNTNGFDRKGRHSLAIIPCVSNEVILEMT
jgi:hypothetical protein